MQAHESDREQHMRELAAKLLFDVEKRDGRFSLSKTSEVPRPIRHENLTLEETEALLNNWKLHGFHGG